jgi:hypothetical protein
MKMLRAGCALVRHPEPVKARACVVRRKWPALSEPYARPSAVFGSGREIGHQLYKEFGARKLDGVILRHNDPLYPGWVINSV